MRRIFEIGMILIVVLVLVGCFPSERLYVMESCERSTCETFPVDSELAFVKEAEGEVWRLWVKQPGGTFKDVCGSTIEGGVFDCEYCEPGKDDSVIIKKISSSKCKYQHCLRIWTEGQACPNPGTGRGGNN